MTVKPRINASSGGNFHLGALFQSPFHGSSASPATNRTRTLLNEVSLPRLRHRAQECLRSALSVACLVLFTATGCGTQGMRIPTGRSGEQQAPCDLHGRPVDPLKDSTARATVLLFVQTDCPISNRYAPEVKRLYDRFASQHIAFHLVYPDPSQSPERILAHLKLYSYPCAAIRDPHHVLVAKAGATVTPEAAVFVGPSLVYRGRIDDRFIEFGRARIEPSQRDLEAVLLRLAHGETVPFRTTQALGCFISDLAP